MLAKLKCWVKGHDMLSYGYGNQGMIKICSRCDKTKISEKSKPVVCREGTPTQNPENQEPAPIPSPPVYASAVGGSPYQPIIPIYIVNHEIGVDGGSFPAYTNKFGFQHWEK